MAELHRTCDSVAQAKLLAKEEGIRYTALLKLPYWLPVTSSCIDYMHVMCLGVLKTAFEALVVPLLPRIGYELDRRVQHISKYLNPSLLGRLPDGIAEHYSSFKASQVCVCSMSSLETHHETPCTITAGIACPTHECIDACSCGSLMLPCWSLYWAVKYHASFAECLTCVLLFIRSVSRIANLLYVLHLRHLFLFPFVYYFNHSSALAVAELLAILRTVVSRGPNGCNHT